MSSLYILTTKNALNLEESLRSLPAEYHKIDDTAWALYSEKNSRSISEALFPRGKDKQVESHIVIRVSDAYWGWHDAQVWEFMSKKD